MVLLSYSEKVPPLSNRWILVCWNRTNKSIAKARAAKAAIIYKQRILFSRKQHSLPDFFLVGGLWPPTKKRYPRKCKRINVCMSKNLQSMSAIHLGVTVAFSTRNPAICVRISARSVFKFCHSNKMPSAPSVGHYINLSFQMKICWLHTNAENIFFSLAKINYPLQ